MSRPVACWAVVPAGGSGSRFSAAQDKLLAPLAGIPVLCHTVAALLACPEIQGSGIQGIVLVASEKNLPHYQDLLSSRFPTANLKFATGGPTRRASVYAGLLALPDGVEVVAIHDAARPLVQPTTIAQTITAVIRGAAGSLVAQPVVDTVKQVDPETLQIQRTIDRQTLWHAQTPQVFRTRELLQAHRQVDPGIEATDDAQLLELAELGPVTIIPGPASNLKITGPDDIPLAESFYHQIQSQIQSQKQTVYLP